MSKKRGRVNDHTFQLKIGYLGEATQGLPLRMGKKGTSGPSSRLDERVTRSLFFYLIGGRGPRGRFLGGGGEEDLTPGVAKIGRRRVKCQERVKR